MSTFLGNCFRLLKRHGEDREGRRFGSSQEKWEEEEEAKDWEFC